MTTRSAEAPDSTAVPYYGATWLRRYESVDGADAMIKDAEMTAFEQLIAPHRRTLRSALDIGTCTGRYLAWAITAGADTVVGIDRSDASVAHCAASGSLGSTTVLHGDIRRPESAALLQQFARFDLITMMMGTINHFRADELPVVLRTVAACVADRGVVVLSAWTPGRLQFSLYSERERSFLEARHLTPAALEPLCEDAGLQVSSTLTIDHLTLFLLEPAR